MGRWPGAAALMALLMILGAGSAKGQGEQFIEEDDGTANGMEEGRLRHILDSVAGGSYDRRIRPHYGVRPTEVQISIHVLDVPSVSAEELALIMYFRQRWRDPRLAFEPRADGGPDEIRIASDDALWTPDTFIVNQRGASTSSATCEFIQLTPDGTVLVSRRLQVTVACRMDLHSYPMDGARVCYLQLESFGHRSQDLAYQWGEVTLGADIDVLEGHDLKDRTVSVATGNYSSLTLELTLKGRQLGRHITQLYVPATMVVLVAYVSFWLDRGAITTRVGLGASSCLSLVLLIAWTSQVEPGASYPKANDVYLLGCFGLVFVSLVEYTITAFGNFKALDRAFRLLYPLLAIAFMAVYFIMYSDMANSTNV